MKNNSKISAIIFDLDDTLIDSRTAEYNAISTFKKMFNEFNKIDEKEFAELWHNIVIELYDKYLKGEVSIEEQRIERIKRLFSQFNVNIEYSEAKEKLKIYLNLYKKNWILFNDTIEVLQKLEDRYELAIITNGDSFQQREKIKQMKLEKYFPNIIISSEVGVAKPKREIFEIACNRLKVKPCNCIMVGDKYEVDIEGSIKSGMKAIWINRKNEDIKYEYEIKELKELLKMNPLIENLE